jgi:glycosyltransferase involved in cell wall biosynthesis
VLVLLENLPLDRDTRVRRECRALLDAGYGVSVIAPRGSSRGKDRSLPEVRLHTYPPLPFQPRTKLGYLAEYGYSFVMTTLLVAVVELTEGCDALQACNPPDVYFTLGWPLKLFGKAFVFDHHDLSPELFTVRFGSGHPAVVFGLRALERASVRAADHVIVTNQSFRDRAISAHGKSPDRVTVVRNGPELRDVQPRAPRPELKEGRQHLCCWVGIMGAVDEGLDIALDAIHDLVESRGRRDCHFAFVGDGEALEDPRALATRLGIAEYVTFTGWVSQDVVFDYLSTADLGLQPDPKNARLDLSTAAKTIEYMAFGLPIVAFDLHETRMSAQDAAVYADPNDATSFPRLIEALLDDPERRRVMGAIGRRRVEEELAWDHQRRRYVSVFRRLLGKNSAETT